MLALWEVCSEVGNKFAVRQVSEPRRGVHNLVVLSCDASYRGVDVLPPSRQGQLPQDWRDGGGCADTFSVGPSLCLCVIDMLVDVRQGCHPRGKDQELHE